MDSLKMVKFQWEYSAYSDILHIHKKGFHTLGSVEFGDFTLDFGKNDEVVGLEIEHASDFFGNVDIDKKALGKIQNATFIIDMRNSKFQVIFLSLEFPGFVKKIPMPLPVVS